jgi:t-SNARE complex subunit (syntaxin)
MEETYNLLYLNGNNDQTMFEKEHASGMSKEQLVMENAQLTNEEFAVEHQNEEHLTNEHLTNEQVDATIVKERNEEIKQITKDVGTLSEVFHTIQHMLLDQGIDLDLAFKNVEDTEAQTGEAVTHLENASKHQNHAKGVRNATIVVGGAALGSVGWLGGPIIGSATMTIGIGISVGIVVLLRKIGL